MREFAVGDVVVAQPYVIMVEGPDGRREHRYRSPVWMVITDASWGRYNEYTVDLIHIASRALKRHVDRLNGPTDWTSGLEGTKHQLPTPDEWPDEVCIALAKRAMIEGDE